MKTRIIEIKENGGRIYFKVQVWEWPGFDFFALCFIFTLGIGCWSWWSDFSSKNEYGNEYLRIGDYGEEFESFESAKSSLDKYVEKERKRINSERSRNWNSKIKNKMTIKFKYNLK